MAAHGKQTKACVAELCAMTRAAPTPHKANQTQKLVHTHTHTHTPWSIVASYFAPLRGSRWNTYQDKPVQESPRYTMLTKCVANIQSHLKAPAAQRKLANLPDCPLSTCCSRLQRQRLHIVACRLRPTRAQRTTNTTDASCSHTNSGNGRRRGDRKRS